MQGDIIERPAHMQNIYIYKKTECGLLFFFESTSLNITTKMQFNEFHYHKA